MPSPTMNEIPFPEYVGDEEKVFALYLAYWKLIEKEVLRLSLLDPTAETAALIQYQVKSLQRIENLFDDMGQEMALAVSFLLYDAYLSGAAYTVIAKGADLQREDFARYNRTLKQTKVKLNYLYKPSRNYQVKKLITDTQSDLLKATHNTKENVKRLVRSTVSEVMSGNAARPQKKENIEVKVKEALKRNRLKEGLQESDVAIIDKRGRRWKLDTYVQMVVRTKTSTAYFDGIRERALVEGMDLAVINTHPDTTDACLNFQGMVISLNGRTKGYPTYHQLKASKLIFHPNCRHFARPIPSIDWLPPEDRKVHEKKLTQYRKKVS